MTAVPALPAVQVIAPKALVAFRAGASRKLLDAVTQNAPGH